MAAHGGPSPPPEPVNAGSLLLSSEGQCTLCSSGGGQPGHECCTGSDGAHLQSPLPAPGRRLHRVQRELLSLVGPPPRCVAP